jgi:hypothetical protein
VAITTILCADWSKSHRKRAVWSATTTGAVKVGRIFRPTWTLSSLLDEAHRLSDSGPVLVALDAPLGVPDSYAQALARRTGLNLTASFLDLLTWTWNAPRYFEPVTHTCDWDVTRPFFAVPAGAGGRTSFGVCAADAGVMSLLRRIDRVTGAKPVFVTSGIPGSVGSSACDVWLSLRALLQRPRTFGVWPFDGSFESLTASRPVVLAEVYPRAAYATALLDGPIAQRARLKLAKTDDVHRHAALEQLATTAWVRDAGVQFDDLAWARDNEDDFDACITAAALLRCAIKHLPLSEPLDASAGIEGGILGSGSVNLALREVTYRVTGSAGLRSAGHTVVNRVPGRASVPVSESPAAEDRAQRGGRQFVCPIPGCDKVFRGSRGGWDAHVGAARLHPGWHADVTRPEDRRHLFKHEFGSFFDT